MTYNPSLYRIHHLQRQPTGVGYKAHIGAIGHIMGRLPRAELYVDFTGVGRGIFDMLVDHGLRPHGIAMTGGMEVHRNPHAETASVPKSTLISKLVARIHGGELVVPRDLPGWPLLRQELESFRNEVTAAGHETWNARTGAHDDLIIAVALCVWGLSDEAEPYSGLFRYYAREAGHIGSERLCVGVDLADANDHTAICVMSRIDSPSQSDVRHESFRAA